MIFRQATDSDFDVVMEIIEDGRAALANLGIDQWQGESPNAAMIRNDMALGRTYVAVMEERDIEASGIDVADGAAPLKAGDIVGTLAYVATGESDYSRITCGAWLTDSPNSSEEAAAASIPVSYTTLHRVATSARATRRGVASFMLRASMELAREQGLKSVRADTHAGNGPMQHTFEKCGMTRCCEIELSDPGEPTKERIGYEIVV